MMPLVLREAPDASIVAASLSADQMEQFGLVLAASNEEVVQAVAAALRRSATDVSTVQTYQMRLERAVAHLERHDAVGALRELTGMLELSADGNHRAGTADADEMLERFVSQVLLIGSVSPASGRHRRAKEDL